MKNSRDQEEPEFHSWRSYWDFAQQIRTKQRFVWGADIQNFLDTVSETLAELAVEVKEGQLLWRAQLGVKPIQIIDDDGSVVGLEPLGYPAERMKPLANAPTEGRVNPAGIPVLYMSTNRRTAISEVRPWIGHSVSVAQFRVRRRLKAVNLSKKLDDSELGINIPVDDDGWWTADPDDPRDKEQFVWRDIERAFSRPVTLAEDRTAYVPTQVLAELFRQEGFDAVIYRSTFGKDGYNVALFDLDDAEILNCSPYEVTDVEVAFKQSGNSWFARQRN